MHILRVNVTFYDAFNIIHDVIPTPNPFPYTAEFMFVGAKKIMKLNKSDFERLLEYVHSAVVFQKYLTRLGEMIIFSPRLENYQFSQPR